MTPQSALLFARPPLLRRAAALLPQVRTFLMVGALGFAVDLSITLLLTQALGAAPVLAKPFGVAGAFFLTFVMNRRFTFRRREAGRAAGDLARYFVSCATAQSVNYLVYCGALPLASLAGLAAGGAPAVAAASAMGAGVAANVTFLMARNYAFAGAAASLR
ncbi:MAG: GtrA-like protein [Hyphomicrobiales bacterium]|nr:GtrA-like protein [Hyphomicrobiales bacterium]